MLFTSYFFINISAVGRTRISSADTVSRGAGSAPLLRKWRAEDFTTWHIKALNFTTENIKRANTLTGITYMEVTDTVPNSSHELNTIRNMKNVCSSTVQVALANIPSFSAFHTVSCLVNLHETPALNMIPCAKFRRRDWSMSQWKTSCTLRSFKIFSLWQLKTCFSLQKTCQWRLTR